MTTFFLRNGPHRRSSISEVCEDGEDEQKTLIDPDPRRRDLDVGIRNLGFGKSNGATGRRRAPAIISGGEMTARIRAQGDTLMIERPH